MPSLQFIPILSLLVIVSFTSLAYVEFPSAFAQTEVQENTTKTTIPELERMVLSVHINDDSCTIPEKFDAIVLKCQDNHLIISIPPEQLGGLFSLDSKVFPGKPNYFGSDSPDYSKADLFIAYESSNYLTQKNKMISERALGNDVVDVTPKIVKMTIQVDAKNCVFPENLGLNKTEFDCKQSKMIVNAPASSIGDLVNLDFVKAIVQYQKPCPECYSLPMPFEETPVISEQTPIKSTITTESNAQDYTSFLLILFIVPVSVVAILCWRLRKKEKIEV